MVSGCLCWCLWVTNHLAIDFILDGHKLPIFKRQMNRTATWAPIEGVYMTVTPLGSHERDIAVQENKQTVVHTEFAVFYPTNCMQYSLRVPQRTVR